MGQHSLAPSRCEPGPRIPILENPKHRIDQVPGSVTGEHMLTCNDVHAARGWIVRQSRFEDIYCAGEGLAEHAIHFWVGSRDTVVENNVIVDCARAIGFGLGENGNGEGRAYQDDPYPGAGYIGHYDGLIRNNAVWAAVEWFDTGIGLEQARGA